MCDTCGCNQPGEKFTIIRPGKEPAGTHSHIHSHGGSVHAHDHSHSHDHPHDHSHDHDHDHPHTHEDHTLPRERLLSIEQDVLGRNDLLAERNRGYFDAKNIFALNLVSSPGSGKTSILERTIGELKNTHRLYVIEGDQQTSNDAERIEKAGAPAIQVNTGNGCHLDAEMIQMAYKELTPSDHSILFIENVGNLVCPALFDLGESRRVVIVSVTEGEDKPLKYPNMFLTSQLCLVNKTDLLPYLDFSVVRFKTNALRVNPHLRFIELSAKTGEGFEEWTRWLQDNQ